LHYRSNDAYKRLLLSRPAFADSILLFEELGSVEPDL
jgi:hypothetical protein